MVLLTVPHVSIIIVIGILEEDAEPDTKRTWIAIDLHTSALGELVPDHDHNHGLALLPDAIAVHGPALRARTTPIAGTTAVEDDVGQEMDATLNQAMSRWLLGLLRRAWIHMPLPVDIWIQRFILQRFTSEISQALSP